MRATNCTFFRSHNFSQLTLRLHTCGRRNGKPKPHGSQPKPVKSNQVAPVPPTTDVPLPDGIEAPGMSEKDPVLGGHGHEHGHGGGDNAHHTLDTEEHIAHVEHDAHLSNRSLCSRIFIGFGGIAFFMVMTASSASWITKPAEEPSAHWSYQGELGPQHWGMIREYYETCGTGQVQSPININTATVGRTFDDGQDEVSEGHNASAAARYNATFGSLLTLPNGEVCGPGLFPGMFLSCFIPLKRPGLFCVLDRAGSRAVPSDTDAWDAPLRLWRRGRRCGQERVREPAVGGAAAESPAVPDPHPV